jgi:transposase
MNLVELRNKGLSIREAARVTGYSRNTVRKWLRSGTLPAAGRSPRRQGPSKLDPYKAYLVRRLGEGVTSSPRLLREVVAQGYTGKVTILKDFLKPFRVALAPRATARFETAPGEQAQVDFAEFA